MAKEWAKKFYNSKAWLTCRSSYISIRFNIDGGLCEVCKEQQGYIVHHKIQLTEENISNPMIALNHNLLSFECKECHDKHEGHGVRGTGTKDIVKPNAVFDANGQPIDIRN